MVLLNREVQKKKQTEEKQIQTQLVRIINIFPFLNLLYIMLSICFVVVSALYIFILLKQSMMLKLGESGFNKVRHQP